MPTPVWRLAAIALLATSASLPGVGPSGAVRPDVPLRDYVDFGADPAFDAATLVRFRDSPIGSGVLVGARWVLSAGHFTVPLPRGGLSVEVGGQTVGVDSVVAHPHFGSDRPEGAPAVDLALLRLAEPVLSVDPALRHSYPRHGSPVGRVGAIVGFGHEADATTLIRDTGGPTGRRVGGLNRIDTDDAATYGPEFAWHVSDGQKLYADFDWPAGDAPEDRPLDLEYVPLLGDSGAPVYVETAGTWRLVAITQGSIGPDENEGLRDLPVHETVAVFTRVVPHYAWINETTSRL